MRAGKAMIAGGAEQRHRVEEHHDRPAQDGGRDQGQGDAKHGADAPAPQDVRRLLHFGGHPVQRVGGEHEDVGEGVQRRHQHHAGKAVDVEQPVLRPGEPHPNPVEPPRIWPGQQDPRDRAQIGRGDERAQDHHPHHALTRHVRAGHAPGNRHCKQRRQDGDLRRVQQRVSQRLEVANAAIRDDVIAQRERTAIRVAQAGQHQRPDRADHQEHQGGERQCPHHPRDVEPAQPQWGQAGNGGRGRPGEAHRALTR